MSRSSGTGSPVIFCCPVARRVGYGYAQHAVTLTGRTRPYHPRGALIRGTSTAREYTCTCGYTGWSNHSDLTLPRFQGHRPC